MFAVSDRSQTLQSSGKNTQRRPVKIAWVSCIHDVVPYCFMTSKQLCELENHGLFQAATLGSVSGNFNVHPFEILNLLVRSLEITKNIPTKWW